MEEIKKLEAQHPIKFHGNPQPEFETNYEPKNKMIETDSLELEEILDDMEWNAEGEKATFNQLSDWFEELT